MPSYSVTITRADEWDDGYEVWAKQRVAPLEYGDGTYVGMYPILPSAASVTFSWTSPGGTGWIFSATQVQRRELGLTGVGAL